MQKSGNDRIDDELSDKGDGGRQQARNKGQGAENNCQRLAG